MFTIALEQLVEMVKVMSKVLTDGKQTEQLEWCTHPHSSQPGIKSDMLGFGRLKIDMNAIKSRLYPYTVCVFKPALPSSTCI